VALPERVLLASSDEGDCILDPFSGGGAPQVAALRLRRHAFGCELSAEYLNLSIRRIFSNLVQVELSLTTPDFSIDLFSHSVDRSKCVSSSLQLVQQEIRFHFIGSHDRRVIFSVLANSLDEARHKFRASGHPDSDARFIIKTETAIYLA
jgi:DNA methylase